MFEINDRIKVQKRLFTGYRSEFKEDGQLEAVNDYLYTTTDSGETYVWHRE